MAQEVLEWLPGNEMIDADLSKAGIKPLCEGVNRVGCGFLDDLALARSSIEAEKSLSRWPDSELRHLYLRTRCLISASLSPLRVQSLHILSRIYLAPFRSIPSSRIGC
jgi:hypothetical protein